LGASCTLWESQLLYKQLSTRTIVKKEKNVYTTLQHFSSRVIERALFALLYFLWQKAFPRIFSLLFRISSFAFPCQTGISVSVLSLSLSLPSSCMSAIGRASIFIQPFAQRVEKLTLRVGPNVFSVFRPKEEGLSTTCHAMPKKKKVMSLENRESKKKKKMRGRKPYSNQ